MVVARKEDIVVAGSRLRYVDITGVVKDALMTRMKKSGVKGVAWRSCPCAVARHNGISGSVASRPVQTEKQMARHCTPAG